MIPAAQVWGEYATESSSNIFCTQIWMGVGGIFVKRGNKQNLPCFPAEPEWNYWMWYGRYGRYGTTFDHLKCFLAILSVWQNSVNANTPGVVLLGKTNLRWFIFQSECVIFLFSNQAWEFMLLSKKVCRLFLRPQKKSYGQAGGKLVKMTLVF